MLVWMFGGVTITAPVPLAVAVVPGVAPCKCTSTRTEPLPPAAGVMPSPPAVIAASRDAMLARRDSSAVVSFGRS